VIAVGGRKRRTKYLAVSLFRSEHAHYDAVLEKGRVAASKPAAELAPNLSLGAMDRKWRLALWQPIFSVSS
jgi:hypothetical protein